VKTLYTGHVTIDSHDVYSFIYADDLIEAERYLTALLDSYIRDHHLPTPLIPSRIRVISRPQGWDPPDGYYLPGTSKQYAIKYPSHKLPMPDSLERSSIFLSPESRKLPLG
jgi:hypothetical protein